MWLIYKEFRFEAAHRLPHHPGKCQRLHGHSWLGRVYLHSDRLIPAGEEQGMVMDFGRLQDYLTPLLEDYLDHYYLNETLGMESPTSEAIAEWIAQQLLARGLKELHSVEIRETCTSGTRYFVVRDGSHDV
ncbi:MAG: 6-carboxytetrahydropterin synthase QueD [Merismopediaceae bacterium]|nr:6-carboxytetrahydropterin synthase QueD [Merismopediaceae bacterium]